MEVVRLLIVVGVLGGAVAVGRFAARRYRPRHVTVDVSDLGDRPGVVVFTSTDCETCTAALAAVERLGAPIREVTWELEPAVFEERDVAAVPLVVVVSASGEPVGQTTGVPRDRWLRDVWERARG